MNTLAKPKENLIDPLILIPILLLTSISALFIFSASNVIASENFNNPFFFIERQVVAFALSLIMFSVFLFIPISFYRENGLLLFFLSAILLALVLIPGIGREVNGSRRWLDLGFMNIAKIFVPIYTYAGHFIGFAE